MERFFDGNPETEKGRIVMDESQESIRKLKQMGISLKSSKLSITRIELI